MKKVSYTGKKKEELIKALNEKRVEIRDMRFGAAGSKARNVKGQKSARKDIARILTELNK